MQSPVTRIIIHPCIRENPRLSEEGRGFLSLRSKNDFPFLQASQRRRRRRYFYGSPLLADKWRKNSRKPFSPSHSTKNKTPQAYLRGFVDERGLPQRGCPKSILALVCVGRGRSVWRRNVSPRQNHGVIRIEFPPRPTGYRHLGIFAPLVNDGCADRHEKAPLAVLRCGNSFGVGVPNCVCHLSLVGRGCCSERSSNLRIV